MAYVPVVDIPRISALLHTSVFALVINPAVVDQHSLT